MSFTSASGTFDVMSDVVLPKEPEFTVEFAKQIMSVRLSEEGTDRVRELLGKNNAGTLSSEEKELLDQYLLIGDFIDLLQAKASLFLKEHAANG
jgi:hypothetical protein